MLRLFSADSEKDIMSNVYWDIDVEFGWGTGAYLVHTNKDLSAEAAGKILADYAKEKDIDTIYLLHDYDRGSYECDVCDYSGEVSKGDAVLIFDEYDGGVDEHCICIGSSSQPGFIKNAI